MRRTWREGSFTGDLEDMLSKALETDICCHRGPPCGNIAGRSFPRFFERSDKFPYLEEFL